METVGVRPCFVSQAQAREFEALVDYARQGIGAAGEAHARGAIEAVAPLSHDVDAVMRCAKADIASSARSSGAAHQLIAEAAKSPEAEAWVSRQLLAGQKPSQILAELRRATKPVIAAIGGDGPVGLTVASLVMFALPFAVLGWMLPT